jgi:hypothetical protein
MRSGTDRRESELGRFGHGSIASSARGHWAIQYDFSGYGLHQNDMVKAREISVELFHLRLGCFGCDRLNESEHGL